MKLKLLLFTIIVISKVISYILMTITIKQRKKPLPIEVRDIYEKERYESFLHYREDYRATTIISDLISIITAILFFFTPFFQSIEKLAKAKVIPTLILTIVICELISYIPSTIISYYRTFTIEEKYGKNKKTKGMFIREALIDFIMGLFLYFLIFGVFLFFKAHLFRGSLHLSFYTALRDSLIVTFMIIVLGLIIMSISYIYLHILYTFTPLEDGELKTAINDLMRDCKKKVKSINVYNESKRSTSKNAFLLKMPFHKEFGIADNFLEENSQRELLAVLAHEVGHLKHKKNLLNYLQYALFVVAFFILLFFFTHLSLVDSFVALVNESFSLTQENDYLLLLILITLAKPIIALLQVFHNYVSRKEEYEADDNAVKEGYGQELIDTFKRLSSDEFVEIYPADIVEWLTFDHPGMYHRICHIENRMKKAA